MKIVINTKTGNIGTLKSEWKHCKGYMVAEVITLFGCKAYWKNYTVSEG